MKIPYFPDQGYKVHDHLSTNKKMNEEDEKPPGISKKKDHTSREGKKSRRGG
jgi:hypothetical protein